MNTAVICKNCSRESCDEVAFLKHIDVCSGGRARIGCRQKSIEDDKPENWEASEVITVIHL